MKVIIKKLNRVWFTLGVKEDPNYGTVYCIYRYHFYQDARGSFFTIKDDFKHIPWGPIYAFAPIHQEMFKKYLPP